MLVKTKQENNIINLLSKTEHRSWHIYSSPLPECNKSCRKLYESTHILDYNHSTPPLATSH